MKYIGNDLLNVRDNRANFNISLNNLVDVMNNETWKKSSIDEFTVKFNGEAVESNEMDVDELATSLLGMSTVLENANIVLNGKNSKVFVKVHSSFRPGSFIVDIATFFTSDGITALVNIGEIIGFGAPMTGALIWLFKRTKGKKILSKKQIQGEENKYEITVENCENPLIINGDVIAVYENAQVRRGLANVVYPLKNVGISDITFLKNGEVVETILRDEREYFSLIESESIDKKEDIDYFLITQSNFEGKQTGWRLSFGDSILSDKNPDFPVKITDNDFLQRVKTHEIKISNEGTIIKARYIKTTQKLERLTVSWEILQVLETDYTPTNSIDTKQKKLSLF